MPPPRINFDLRRKEERRGTSRHPSLDVEVHIPSEKVIFWIIHEDDYSVCPLPLFSIPGTSPCYDRMPHSSTVSGNVERVVTAVSTIAG